MLPIFFHPDTKIAVKESFTWYQLQSKGLGHEFVQELDEAFNSIQSLPSTWPKIGQSHRRFILARFPFSIIYKVRDNSEIYVVAVMYNHLNQGFGMNAANKPIIPTSTRGPRFVGILGRYKSAPKNVGQTKHGHY